MDNVEWALAYARAGFAVLPVWNRAELEEGKWTCSCDKGLECDRPAKHPIPKQGVKQATREEGRIRVWWEAHPEANIAIATGSVSDVIVIDVDTGDDKEGDVAITQACADKGGVPRTLKASSGSGGRHYWYAFRKNPFTRKIGFLKHVDYLSDGGYVIVEPSVNLKGPYKWDAEVAVDGPGDVKRLRAEMLELPEWFDELVGVGRAGRKKDKAAKATDDIRLRLVNTASMEFKPTDPRWVNEIRKALSYCDPDSRDHWVLFGIILGRAFDRSDDGWNIYVEWSSRSAKFGDPGTDKNMRNYFYKDSLDAPHNGRQSTIATIMGVAAEHGYPVPANGLDERPIITYRPGRAIETVEGVLRRLAIERESGADQAARIYAFGSGLGSILEGHDIGARYTQEGRPPNGWVLRVGAHSPMSLGSRITNTVTIMKATNAGSVSQVECPVEVSSLMLSDHTKNFPRLNGIVQWPMVINGKIAGTEEEYDPSAGLVFSLPETLDLSGLKGSVDKAKEAWQWLRTVALDGFPFHTPRDEAAALALLLTFVQRRAMEAAPAFLITAPKIGTGKTTLVRFASRAIHGRSIGAGPLSADGEEQRKAITAALLSNPPALLFDNLKAGSSFNSNELAIAMTSGEWEDRKLGSTERLVLPNRAVWTFTGNNISLKSDLRRRFVVIRMVSKEVAHHEQIFNRDIDTWPVLNRPLILKALMEIMLWGSQDATQLKSESGFPQWDHDVRRVVYALTGVDPFRSLVEQEGEEEDDEEEEAISRLMLAWTMLCGDESRTVSEFMARVKESEKSSDSAKRAAAESVSEAVAVLREKPAERLEALDYGHSIKMLQDRLVVIEGVSLHFSRRGMRSKVALWELRGATELAEKVADRF